MTEELLTRLRERGVYIPDNLDDAALLAHAKQLIPWTVTTGDHDGEPWATTRKREASSPDSIHLMYGDTAAEAALKLLSQQLADNLYTVQDTTYKLSAHQRYH